MAESVSTQSLSAVTEGHDGSITHASTIKYKTKTSVNNTTDTSAATTTTTSTIKNAKSKRGSRQKDKKSEHKQRTTQHQQPQFLANSKNSNVATESPSCSSNIAGEKRSRSKSRSKSRSSAHQDSQYHSSGNSNKQEEQSPLLNSNNNNSSSYSKSNASKRATSRNSTFNASTSSAVYSPASPITPPPTNRVERKRHYGDKSTTCKSFLNIYDIVTTIYYVLPRIIARIGPLLFFLWNIYCRGSFHGNNNKI